MEADDELYPLRSMDDDSAIQWLVDSETYNPLEDTRPFYYATYEKVRGNSQVYQSNMARDGARFMLDSLRGDEFQLVKSSEGKVAESGGWNPSSRISFMDILNTRVYFQTQKRIYNTDMVDGGRLLLQEEMDRRDDEAKMSRSERKRQWCFGEEGGLNFDLPTEAQWEHCCRMGNKSAFPVAQDLGFNYEESNEFLDLIAWYKYKVIGAAPEPERFCAWRAAKFMFGIAKDKEMVNNVYETTTD